MNNRHLHLLFNDNIQSVSVVFEVGGKSYTYLTTQDVQAGQPVITSISGNPEAMDLRVAYAVDDSGAADIDWDAPFDYKYIADVVDVEAWKMQLNDHSKKIIAGRKIEKQRAKAMLRKEIEEAYKDCPELLSEFKGVGHAKDSE